MLASRELDQAFPDMRKRKLSANALPYTVFKLIQKEVEEAQDETATKYFVEAFCDRQTVFDNIVKELESTVVLEKQMSSGDSMKSPEFLLDTDIESSPVAVQRDVEEGERLILIILLQSLVKLLKISLPLRRVN